MGRAAGVSARRNLPNWSTLQVPNPDYSLYTQHYRKSTHAPANPRIAGPVRGFHSRLYKNQPEAVRKGGHAETLRRYPAKQAPDGPQFRSRPDDQPHPGEARKYPGSHRPEHSPGSEMNTPQTVKSSAA